jgi:hypothetical protein
MKIVSRFLFENEEFKNFIYGTYIIIIKGLEFSIILVNSLFGLK